MNKPYLSLVAIVISIVAIVAVFTKSNDFLGFASQNTTIIDIVSHSATTTAGVEPTKLMSSSTNRIFAEIQNDNLTGVVWIYLGDFQNSSSASSTVIPNRGIRLDAGDSYKFLPENTYTGAVWATTTPLGLSILVTEK